MATTTAKKVPPAHIVTQIAATAPCDVKTVKAFYLGLPGKPAVRDRIRQAISDLGLDVGEKAA